MIMIMVLFINHLHQTSQVQNDQLLMRQGMKSQLNKQSLMTESGDHML